MAELPSRGPNRRTRGSDEMLPRQHAPKSDWRAREPDRAAATETHACRTVVSTAGHHVQPTATAMPSCSAYCSAEKRREWCSTDDHALVRVDGEETTRQPHFVRGAAITNPVGHVRQQHVGWPDIRVDRTRRMASRANADGCLAGLRQPDREPVGQRIPRAWRQMAAGDEPARTHQLIVGKHPMTPGVRMAAQHPREFVIQLLSAHPDILALLTYFCSRSKPQRPQGPDFGAVELHSPTLTHAWPRITHYPLSGQRNRAPALIRRHPFVRFASTPSQSAAAGILVAVLPRPIRNGSPGARPGRADSYARRPGGPGYPTARRSAQDLAPAARDRADLDLDSADGPWLAPLRRTCPRNPAQSRTESPAALPYPKCTGQSTRSVALAFRRPHINALAAINRCNLTARRSETAKPACRKRCTKLDIHRPQVRQVHRGQSTVCPQDILRPQAKPYVRSVPTRNSSPPPTRPASVRGDIVATNSHQESIKQSPQRIVLRQVVTGPDHHQCGHRSRLATAPKHAFVEHAQQAVQDRAVGVQQLVQEHEGRFGQHAFGIRHQFSRPASRRMSNGPKISFGSVNRVSR